MNETKITRKKCQHKNQIFYLNTIGYFIIFSLILYVQCVCPRTTKQTNASFHHTQSYTVPGTHRNITTKNGEKELKKLKAQQRFHCDTDKVIKTKKKKKYSFYQK